jgi:hypothetical protein
MPIGAVIGGAAIAGVATVGAGAMGASAQRDAARTAADTSLATANANNALAREVRGQNLQIASPFYNNGLLAGNALTDLLLGTNEYNPNTVANPTVPGGGTFPATTGATGGQGALTPYTGPSLAQIEALRHDGIPGNHDPAMRAYRAAEASGALNMAPTPTPTTPTTPTTPATGNTTPTTGSTAPASALDAFARFRQGTNYNWRLNEGANALTSNLARGTLDSGAAQRAIVQYGQNFASNELGNYMNLLASQQASGLSAAGAVMGVNTSYQGNVTANNNNASSAAANAALASGQASAGMWNSVGNAAGQIGGALFQYGTGGYRAPTAQSYGGGGINVTSNPNYWAGGGGISVGPF